jgi:hypothetical protein
MRPYVTEAQKLPLNGYAVKLVNPETAAGIFVLRRVALALEFVVRCIKWSGMMSWFAREEGGHADRAEFDLQLEGVEEEGKKER